MKNKITVLMAVYNGQRYLVEAIDSILAQTIKDFNFIIVNDGSTDNTVSILEGYTDQRITVLNQRNAGLASALNSGLEHSKTELILRMDADDIAYPNRIETQIEEYEKLERPDVMGSAVEYINSNGKTIEFRKYPQSHEDIKKSLMRLTCPLIHPTVMFKRKKILELGGYDDKFYYSGQDFELWLRISDHCKMANSDKPVLKLRINDQSKQASIISQSTPRENSTGWWSCVAMQKYIINNAGMSKLWQNESIRTEIKKRLMYRYCESKRHDSIRINKTLAMLKSSIVTGSLNLKDLSKMVLSLSSHPYLCCRYLIKRSHPIPEFLTIDEVREITESF
ncbi:glycosyltransferase [Candidatus Pacearchaeota archaeon]|nr:glycosyltransferase [Candidatus Pacearchaeota archaeon]